eukprot:COSAG06_NODE_1686_length_8715_cov_11.149838_7_plen_227_part_00
MACCESRERFCRHRVLLVLRTLGSPAGGAVVEYVVEIPAIDQQRRGNRQSCAGWGPAGCLKPAAAALPGLLLLLLRQRARAMAVLTASQLQSRGSLLVRGLGVLLLLFGAARFLLPHLRSPVECSAPKRVAHASVAPAERTTSAKEGDERVLECDAGFVIDGFQPLSSALMLCRDGGGGSGEWQCSDSGMGDSWPCAARGCVEVSHCDPLPDDVDTGCACLYPYPR